MSTIDDTRRRTERQEEEQSISQLLYLLSTDLDNVAKTLEPKTPKVQLALLSNFARRVGNIYDFTLSTFKEQHSNASQRQLAEAKSTIETMRDKFVDLQASLKSMQEMHELEIEERVRKARQEVRSTLNEKLKRRIDETVERECASRLRAQRKTFQKEQSAFLLNIKKNLKHASEKKKKLQSQLQASQEEVKRLKTEIAEYKFRERMNQSRSRRDEECKKSPSPPPRRVEKKKKEVKREESSWIPIYVVCGESGRRELRYKHVLTGVTRRDRPNGDVLKSMKRTIEKEMMKTGGRKTKEQHDEDTMKDAKTYVDRRLKQWRKGKNLHRMLSTLHLIVPNVVGTFWEDEVLKCSSSRRTVYRRALRMVHPDKVRDDVNMYEKMMACGVFSVLTEQKRREDES